MIEYTEEQAAEARRVWRKKKSDLWFLLFLFAAPIVLWWIPGVIPFLRERLGGVLNILIIAYFGCLILIMRRVHSCPGCHKTIRVRGRFRHCPHCGLELSTGTD